VNAPKKSVAVVGAGKMGFAMLEGLAASGLAGVGTLIIEPAPAPQLQAFCDKIGATLSTEAPRDVAAPDALLLAVKPQMLDAAAPALQALVGARTLLVSVLAGKTIANLQQRFPATQTFVRAMPNTPAAIGRGVTGAFASAAVEAEGRDFAQRLLAAVGEVEWVESEAQIDALTAISGCGPAYVFLMAECLAAAGTELGLAPDLAMRLARGTIAGAGELMRASPETPAETLRRNVTSPGGATAAALDVLMAEDGLKPLLVKAAAAAQRRARELAG
jgi:pyrroline-5-carboxylate reductase